MSSQGILRLDWESIFSCLSPAYGYKMLLIDNDKFGGYVELLDYL